MSLAFIFSRLISSTATLKNARKLLFKTKVSKNKITLIRGQTLTKILNCRDHLSTFGAQLKNKHFKSTNNASALYKQFHLFVENVQKITFLTAEMVKNYPL